MRAVNLLPPDYLDARRVPLSTRLGPLGNPARVVPVAAALVLVAILAVGYVTQNRAVNDRQATLDELQAELAARPKATVIAPTSDAGIRLAAATAASNSRIAWEEVLHQLSLVLPADVSLTTLNAGGAPVAVPVAAPADPAAAPAPAPAAGGAFTIAGYTASQPSVARLLTQLEKAPTLTGVTLQNSTRAEREGRASVDFNLTATVVPEGAGS